LQKRIIRSTQEETKTEDAAELLIIVRRIEVRINAIAARLEVAQ
jgi:hypothetical protein